MMAIVYRNMSSPIWWGQRARTSTSAARTAAACCAALTSRGHMDAADSTGVITEAPGFDIV